MPLNFNFDIPEEYKKHNPLFSEFFSYYDNFINENYDNRKKEIGDYVYMWDGSGCCDITGIPFKFRTTTDMLNTKFIVIETKLIYINKVSFLNNEYEMNLDLLLYCPLSKDKVRTNSELCRIIQLPDAQS